MLELILKERNSEREHGQSLNRSRSKRLNAKLQDDFEDLDVSRSLLSSPCGWCSDLKGIMSALQQIREKADEDGRKKKEESISSVSTEVKSKIDELKSKLDKERQNFAKAHLQRCESLLKEEAAKFEQIHHKFMKEKADHLEGLKVTVSKFEENKERLYMRYEQLRKKEKTMISDHERFCTKKLAQLEESLKKKKRADKTFSILRKTLGSFLENEASDEEFPHLMSERLTPLHLTLKKKRHDPCCLLFYVGRFK
uniref:Meiosis-specific protein ASY3-like coiled-coil domain-containing protein n=2 Tax=Brassica oleracea TaxID=3712 RepID=A0A0D3BSC6_BRAOL|nr:unnamed protein product [Brassica oleracea]